MRWFALILFALGATPVLAQELTFAHFGRLLGPGDVPVEGLRTLTFKLYTSPVPLPDEEPVWAQAYEVTIFGGVFTVTLGDPTGGRAPIPASLFESGETLYLTMSVDDGDDLVPRSRIGATPQAAFARMAQEARKAFDLDCVGCVQREALAFDPTPDNGIVSTMIAPGAVTGDHIQQGSITGDHIEQGSIPATALAGDLTFDEVKGTLDGTRLTEKTVTAAALADSFSLDAARVPGLTNLLSVCKQGEVLAGFDENFEPRCVTAGPAALAWSVAELDFSLVSNKPVERTATLRNDGASPATGIRFSALEGFEAVGNCGSLAPGASCQVTFRMLPGVKAGEQRALAAATLAGTGSATIALRGVRGGWPGSSSDLALASCKAILEQGERLADGVYWIDPDGSDLLYSPMQVWCDMTTDGGGWTAVSTGTNAATGLVNSFQYFRRSTIAVAGDETQMHREFSDTGFSIGARHASGLRKTVRFELDTGFPFEELRGSWEGYGLLETQQHDDNFGSDEWLVLDDQSNSGGLQFGTDKKVIKKGNDWKTDWNRYGRRRVYSFGATPTEPTSVLRWGVHDQGSAEWVDFRSIEIFVR